MDDSGRQNQNDLQVQRAAGSSVADLFSCQARLHPERIAVEDGRRRLHYAEFDERTRRLASLLRARGVRHGERIAVLSENRIEYLEVFIAAARLGAIVACLNWRLSESELRHCLVLAEPRFVFVSVRHAPRLDALLEVEAQTIV